MTVPENAVADMFCWAGSGVLLLVEWVENCVELSQ